MALAVEKTSILKDIMTSPTISVTLSYSVYRVLKMAKEENVTGFPVIDIDGKVIGVVSTLDLITEVAVGKLNSKLGELPLTIKVEKEVIKLNQFAAIKDALQTMITTRVGRIFIVDDSDKLCGVISRKDLINFFIDVFDLKAENSTAG